MNNQSIRKKKFITIKIKYQTLSRTEDPQSPIKKVKTKPNPAYKTHKNAVFINTQIKKSRIYKIKNNNQEFRIKKTQRWEFFKTKIAKFLPNPTS